jgi:ribonuclease D
VVGVSERLTDRYGRFLVKAVKQAKSQSKEDWPIIERPKRHRRDEDYDERLKRLKIERDTVANKLELAQGVLCPNTALTVIARERITDTTTLYEMTDLRQWQIEQVGEALFGVVE